MRRFFISLSGIIIVLSLAAMTQGLSGGGLFIVGALLAFVVLCIQDYAILRDRKTIAHLEAELQALRHTQPQPGPVERSSPKPQAGDVFLQRLRQTSQPK